MATNNTAAGLSNYRVAIVGGVQLIDRRHCRDWVMNARQERLRGAVDVSREAAIRRTNATVQAAPQHFWGHPSCRQRG